MIGPYALAVDDDPIILIGLSAALEDAGYTTIAVSTGDAALAILAEHSHRLVLLVSDVDMPGAINGFALAHHVAEHHAWIRIVVASGRSHPVSGELPLAATFMSKPFTRQMLIDRVGSGSPLAAMTFPAGSVVWETVKQHDGPSGPEPLC